MSKPQAYLVLSLLFAAVPSFADDYLKRYDCDPSDAKNVLENLKSSPMRFYTVINGDGAAGNYKPLTAAMLSDEQIRENICKELDRNNQIIGGLDESDKGDIRRKQEKAKEIFSGKGRLYQILHSLQKGEKLAGKTEELKKDLKKNPEKAQEQAAQEFGEKGAPKGKSSSKTGGTVVRIKGK